MSYQSGQLTEDIRQHNYKHKLGLIVCLTNAIHMCLHVFCEYAFHNSCSVILFVFAYPYHKMHLNRLYSCRLSHLWIIRCCIDHILKLKEHHMKI